MQLRNHKWKRWAKTDWWNAAQEEAGQVGQEENED